MKIKIIFSIMMIIALCMGKIYAQNATQILSGTKAGNYEATNSIQSTQVLSKGATTYVAGNEIVLKPGFHAKAGSEFVATIGNPSDYLTIMTYNVHKEHYKDNAKVIKVTEADIVAIQEVEIGIKGAAAGGGLTGLPGIGEAIGGIFGENGFEILKSETGFKGKMAETIIASGYKLGIVLLWNENKLGKPLSVTPHNIARKPAYTNDNDPTRAYIIAEWDDFVIIATHLSTDANWNQEMVNEILNKNIVKNNSKPVIIAGDLNPKQKSGYETKTCLQANGFEILNVMHDMQLAGSNYPNDPYTVEHYNLHATSGKKPPGNQVDLILWKNQNQNRRIIGRGVPECLWAEDLPLYLGGQYADWRFHISDHLPYVVKVKLK